MLFSEGIGIVLALKIADVDTLLQSIRSEYFGMHACASFAAVILVVGLSAAAAPIPVVLWHGMGDNCCNPYSMGRMQQLIEQAVGGGVVVRSIMVGSNPEDDTVNGFLMNVDDQIDLVCKQVSSDPSLTGGFHALGFSQGGQFVPVFFSRLALPYYRAQVFERSCGAVQRYSVQFGDFGCSARRRLRVSSLSREPLFSLRVCSRSIGLWCIY